jgi:1,4-alpha-glucan branching enzyme
MNDNTNNGSGAVEDVSLLTADDLHWFNEGTHCRVYQRMGAHITERGGVPGVGFSVWAPNAAPVFVMSDFNEWNKSRHPLKPQGGSGVWGGFVSKIGKGATDKYHIVSRHNGYAVDKADPYAIRHETAPKTASLVWDLDYAWGDGDWMTNRGPRQKLTSPILRSPSRLVDARAGGRQPLAHLSRSDARESGGSGQGNLGGVEASPFPWQGQSHTLTITLPPLGAVAFKPAPA